MVIVLYIFISKIHKIDLFKKCRQIKVKSNLDITEALPHLKQNYTNHKISLRNQQFLFETFLKYIVF